MKLAIVLTTCDTYTKIAEISAKLLNDAIDGNVEIDKYILYSNNCPNIPNWHAIKCNSENNWSTTMINGLKLIDQDYILHVHDDLLIRNSQNFLNTLRLVIEEKLYNGVSYLRIAGKPNGFPIEKSKYINKIKIGTPYLTSTVFSIWKRDFLIDHLSPGETAWQFEVFGSARIKDGSFYVIKDPYKVSYVNSVVKGKLDWINSRKLLRSYNVNWPKMNMLYNIIYIIQKRVKQFAILVLGESMHKLYLLKKYE